MFERFTDDARRVIVHAQEESRLLGQDHIGTEHLLLGLLHDDVAGNDTVRVLAESGIRLAAVRRQIGQVIEPGTGNPSGHIPFTPRAKRALERSLHSGLRLGHAHLARGHLLLGLLAVPDATAVQVLRALGADLDRLASAAEVIVARSAADEQGDPDAPTAATAGTALRAGGWLRAGSAADLVAEANRLRRERRRFAAALQRYGRHDAGCDPDRGCTCGFGPILALAADG